MKLMGLGQVNKIINGNFDFWQRGTSFSNPSSTAYVSDRFFQRYDGTIGTFSISRQAFATGQTAVPGDPTYYLEWNQTVAGSGSTFRTIAHRIEDVKSIEGKTAVATFWAKADAPRSVIVSFLQNFGTGGSPSSDVVISGATVNLTTSWQKFRVNVDIPSISGKTLGTDVPNNSFLELRFDLPLNTTMVIDLASVMVNENHAAPAFQLAGKNLPEELQLCQRYYEKSYNLSDDPGTVTGAGATWFAFKDSTTNISLYFTVNFKVRKRISVGSPLSTWSIAGTFNQVTEIKQAGTTNDVGGASIPDQSEQNFIVEVNSSGTTAGFALQWSTECEL